MIWTAERTGKMDIAEPSVRREIGNASLSFFCELFVNRGLKNRSIAIFFRKFALKLKEEI
jgi:hypothetical protein